MQREQLKSLCSEKEDSREPWKAVVVCVHVKVALAVNSGKAVASYTTCPGLFDHGKQGKMALYPVPGGLFEVRLAVGGLLEVKS